MDPIYANANAFFSAAKKIIIAAQGSNIAIFIGKVAASQKQGQKLALSDALALQSQGLYDLIGYQGKKVSSLKVVLRSQKMLWDLKKWLTLSKRC